MSVFGHLRGAIRRHPHLADAAIALAVLTAAAPITFTGQHQPATGGDRVFALTAAVIACGALTVRRQRPLVALGVSAPAAETFLFFTPDASGVLILLAPSIALYTVAELVERRRGLIIGGSVLAALTLLHALQQPGMIGPENLAFAALGGLAIAAGDSSRNRRAYLAEVERRAERSEMERELVAQRRVEQERLRIARDLHDSVGHHLALISVQSDVAGRAVDGDAAAAREALLHVKSASRKALEELRDTVSLLRQPGDPVAPTAIPAPGLDALEELLGSLRDSGLAIEYRIRGTALPLAPAADVTAYRVIQEALTNVYKHASQREARLTLSYARRGLRITVDDPGSTGEDTGIGSADQAVDDIAGGPGIGGDVRATHDHAGGVGITRSVRTAPPSLPAGRQGIRGMRERLLALGGRLDAGPRPDGGFRVDAVLPYQPAGIASSAGSALPGGLLPPADIVQPSDIAAPSGSGQPRDLRPPADITQPPASTPPAGSARPVDLVPPVDITRPPASTAPAGSARPVDLVPPVDIAQPPASTPPAGSGRPEGAARPGGAGQCAGENAELLS